MDSKYNEAIELCQVGEYERAIEVMAQSQTISPDEYKKFVGQCNAMILNQYLVLIQQSIESGDYALAQAYKDEYITKYGVNDQILNIDIPQSTKRTIKCHYCGQAILAEAKKYRHCGKLLTNETVSTLNGMNTTANEDSAKEAANSPESVLQNRNKYSHPDNESRDAKNSRTPMPEQKRSLLWIVFGAILFVVIIGIISYRFESPRDSVVEDKNDLSPSLSTRGDSIAYFLAGYNACYVAGYAKSNIDLAPDVIYNKFLSAKGRSLIDIDRFITIYNYYYDIDKSRAMPSMPRWFREQIDILSYTAKLNEENNAFWTKRYHAEYNNAFKDLEKAFEKDQINFAAIDNYIVLNIPDYRATLDSISRLPDEAFKVYEWEYGKWEQKSDGFETKILNADEGTTLTINLLPGKIVISTPYFSDDTPAEATLFIEDSKSYNEEEIKCKFNKDTYTITDSRSIHSFLNACVEPYGNNKLRVQFLYRGASHWGWLYFDLRDLDGAWSAYRAVN